MPETWACKVELPRMPRGAKVLTDSAEWHGSPTLYFTGRSETDVIEAMECMRDILGKHTEELRKKIGT